MFEEIPSPPPPPSQRAMIAFFGFSFALFLSGAAIAWIRWSGPLSLIRRISAGEFIVGCVLSGVFLLTAKSGTPEGNRKRMLTLFLVMMVYQMIIDVLR
jgi:hypothetical protein